MNEFIDPSHKTFIVKKIRSLLPSAAILVFGSRVRGDAKTYSDLDVAIDNNAPISFSILSDLEESFAQSDVPYKIDLLDFQMADPAFQAIILKNAVKW